ncbi:hypothetical protein [Nodularia spumigena]|uniref:hypothetical protein n=1 Tax=Nodularia spumigena TaxID=70799 RepID=UPI00232F6D55|nr:hypothetical protein [Nodularia spumigena]MDB9349419.1 hypothetical protein [Nodularia spumigena CS-588/01]MDB9350819.1 hypothetical protein [Nodularia spumigena CS-588/05]
MNLLEQSRKIAIAFILILVLTITTACGGGTVTEPDRTATPPVGRDVTYAQLERGNTPSGQSFGDWVVQTSNGLIKDAYVRDNNKLGVVISPQVSPNEVRPLAKSLVQGFQKNFPDQNLTVLVYSPDKKLILTTQYDRATNQIQYS